MVAANNSTVTSLTSIPTSLCVAWIVVLSIECLAIVILNAFLVIIFATRRDLKRQRTFLPIRNLAIVDLLAGGISGALQIERTGGDFCSIWSYDQTNALMNNLKFALLHLFSMASLANLAAISLERMYATLRPFQHLTVGKRLYVAIIIAVWLTAVVREIAQMVFYEVYVNVNTDTVILINVTLYLPYYYISFFIITLSYFVIFLKVRWRVYPNRANNSLFRRERKLTITLFIVTLVSLLALAPVITYLTVDAVYRGIFSSFPQIPSFHLRSLVVFCFMANSLANPIIYSWRMQSVREGFKQLFGRIHGNESTIVFRLRSLTRKTSRRT